jgi:hypothetical protein
MLNIKRIIWIYEHFGLWCAVKSAAVDIVALLAFAGYCLTLPFQFIWMLCRGQGKGKL